MRRPKNVFYLKAIRPLDTPTPQAETIPSTVNPNEEVLPSSLPPPGQPEPDKGNTAPPEASSDKTATASEVEVASQNFQQDLASTVLPVGRATKDKEEVITSEAGKPASEALKIQFKLKK